MLAGNFYNMSKCGGKTVKKGTLDAPKLSAGGSGGAGARGIGRGRGFAHPRPIVPAQNLRPTTSKNQNGGRGRGVPPARQLAYEEYDQSDKEAENDSDKENEEPNNPANEVDSDDDDEEGEDGADESEDEWKFKLLEVIQQYPEVYDLAHPR